MLKRLVLGTIAVVAGACNSPPTPPATPTLVSITGHGTPFIGNPVGRFQFANATYNANAGQVVSPSGSTVVFTAPYPTEIEAFIDGKPLTKVDPPNSNRYEYSAVIENPGETPARWSMGVRTPYDVPFFKYQQQTSYTLTIYDVSGSQRSAPLTIRYFNPAPIPLPSIITAVSYSSDSPKQSGSSSGSTTGNCPGGGHDQNYNFCFVNNQDHSRETVGTVACSSSEALKLLVNQHPPSQFGSSSGSC